MGTLTSLLATLLALAHVAVAMLFMHRASSEAKANGMLWIHWRKLYVICTVKVDDGGIIVGVAIGQL